MEPRPQDLQGGVIPTFREEDDCRLGESVDRIRRHWQRVQEEVSLSTGGTVPELRMGCDYLEGQDRNQEGMVLEGECRHAQRPLDVIVEVAFAPETGADAELGLVRPPDPGSSDGDEDDEPPRYALSRPGFLAFSSARVAGLSCLTICGPSQG